MGKVFVNEKYHAAAWYEPLIFELGNPGERGVIMPSAETKITERVGNVLERIPKKLRRKNSVQLPEMSQPHVVRHFMRLSQMCLGADFNIDLGQGTCTMKYNPKINELLASLPEMSELHPLQDEDTVQGILEIIYRCDLFLRAISGLDQFSFQSGGGTHSIFTNACILRAYHEERGEGDKRNEVITTAFSHPANAATAATAGFRVITLYPEEDGYPSVEALKQVLSERTAGLFITNPEDTGLYNPHIKEFTHLVHKAGGLCIYDQANANSIIGVARAREAGFDMCHFNLHKTFGAPHGGSGPACGACGVRKELAKYLPAPVVEFDGKKYYLNYNRPNSVGKIKGFHGNIQAVLRSYAWILSLGPDGIKEVAETAVLNNNYLAKKLLNIPGITLPYNPKKRRLEQIRYSCKELTEQTGVSTEDLANRIVDYGVTDWYPSHHPRLVPEPITLEPTETYSKDDLDEYAAIVAKMFQEARTNPEIIKTAPHRSTVKQADPSAPADPNRWAFSWRMFKKMKEE